MSSRLFQNIREKHGLAYTIYTFSDTWSDSGLFGVYAGTAEDKLNLALEAIELELQAVLDQRIPDSELDRLKSQLRGNLLLSHENVHSRMARIAKMEAYTGSYMPLDGVIDKIRQVNAQDILRVAHQILRPENRYLVAIQPEN
jgi:predicted Zn-dependent peptidase